jgi:hypothetical protein
MARHHDECLSNGKKENSFRDSHKENQQTVNTDTGREDIVHGFLGLRIVKEKVNVNRLFNQIEGMTHDLGRNNAKKIGNDGEYDTQNQVPFVFQEIFIEVSEMFQEF